jgi:hypothetical protein
MENGKTGTNEVLALQGLDMWKAILEETDRRYMQKHILSETSFESSGDESEESECAAIQRTLELENSFSSDGSQDISSISISDVKRATCERCWRFFHAEYVRARTRKSLLTFAITGTPYLEFDNNTLPFLRECCADIL